MIIADLHNDTAYELYLKKEELYENSLHIDLKKQFFSKNLLFFAIYMNPQKYEDDKWKYFYDIYLYFKAQIEKNENEISFFKSTEDFLKNKRHNAVITLEGGDLIDKEEDIEILKRLGIKAITLTWNTQNKLACSINSKTDTGLSQFGKHIIKKMEDEQLLIDLSHCSDKTFFDVIKTVKNPVLISHSNSRKVFWNKRNITDEMFYALIENGGVLGINFYSSFIGSSPTIYDLIEHIEHFLKLGGENSLAFGSDFDGIDKLPEGISDFSSYKKLYEILKKELGNKITEKIFFENVLKIMK